jgi:hypothetical protein
MAYDVGHDARDTTQSGDMQFMPGGKKSNPDLTRELEDGLYGIVQEVEGLENRECQQPCRQKSPR